MKKYPQNLNMTNKATEIAQSDSAMKCYQLGNALRLENRLKEAKEHFQQAIEIQPEFVEAYINLGVVLMDLNETTAAESSFRRSIALNPNFAHSHCNLGIILSNKGHIQEALQCYQNAIEIDPDFAVAYCNLANLFKLQGNVIEAEKHYRRAIAIRSDYAQMHNNLGLLLSEQNRFVEAKEAYQNALNCEPTNPKFMSTWVFTYRRLCDWQSIQIKNQKLLECFDLPNTEASEPIALLATENFQPIHLRQAGELYALRKYSHQLTQLPYIMHAIKRHQKLRIGYLSADFHSHATVYLMAGILENRNNDLFDVYLYSYGVEVKDEGRSRVENACEVFRNVRTLSDEGIAGQILADEIDILIDLKGYTQGERLGVTALRPAPVIFSWLGYPSTLGDRRLADYIIGDPTVTPINHAQHFSETLALMPHCYQPNDNQKIVGEKLTRIEAGLPENAFVFCTFNQAYKITPEMFDIWCRLLGTVPNSVLWLLEPHQAAQENLHREMEIRGIESSRLIFAPKMEQTAHLGRLQLADLAVDTFPYTSHTTASDALWAGVPLVTKMGETFASRVAASILNTIDLAELVTTNDEDYFHVALSLAQNPKKLASIKQKIVEQKQISPLFDTQKFARDLERLYQTIWEQELRGERKAVVLKSEENPDIGEELKHVELRKSFDGCPLCNSVNTKAIIHADVKNHSLYNDYLPSDLTWLECVECKHVFSQHYWTADGLTQIFKNAHSNQVAGGNPDQKRQTWKPVVQNVLTVMGGFRYCNKCRLNQNG